MAVPSWQPLSGGPYRGLRQVCKCSLRVSVTIAVPTCHRTRSPKLIGVLTMGQRTLRNR